MNNIYIQCNGFRQLAKISSFLLAYSSDVKYNDVTIKTTMSNTKVKYEIYLISFPHVDHIGFWEFLMDYAPIPDRFVSCDDIDHDEFYADYIPEYDDPDHPDYIG